MLALHAELDARRRADGLSWVELAAVINRPFENTGSIPISPGTLRDMMKKQSITSAVILQVLRWLKRTPESFLEGNSESSAAEECLPMAERHQILRFDTRALYEAVDCERRRRALTWQQVANELPGFTVAMLTNLAGGPLIGFPRVMLLTQWVNLPAATFVRACSR